MKPLSQKSLATHSLSYQDTILESKGIQELLIRAGYEEANSRRGCLSRGSVSHKDTPTSTLLKHSLRVSLLGNQVSSADSTTVTLIPDSTKEFLHKRWECPRPPHKVVVAAPHQVGGLMTCRRASNAPRGRRTESSFGSQENHNTRAQDLAFTLTKS